MSLTYEHPLDAQIAVIGGGPAGLLAAMAVANAGYDTVLISDRKIDTTPDGRSTAIFAGSLSGLHRHGLLEIMEKVGHPVHQFELAGQGTSKAAVFDRKPVKDLPIALNVRKYEMVEILHSRLKTMPNVDILEDTAVTGLVVDASGVNLHTNDGDTIRVQLCIGADGMKSIVRQTLGIPMFTADLGRAALAFEIEHERPHLGISREIARKGSGPLVTVPLEAHTSAVVWVDRPEKIEALKKKSEDDLAFDFLDAYGDSLGAVIVKTPVVGHKFGTAVAGKISSSRIVLTGEAAHALPPTGAQGFNLTVGDIVELCDLLKETKSVGDPGNAHVTRTYAIKRSPDIALRAFGATGLDFALASGNDMFIRTRNVLTEAAANIAPLQKIGLMLMTGALPRPQFMMPKMECKRKNRFGLNRNG